MKNVEWTEKERNNREKLAILGNQYEICKGGWKTVFLKGLSSEN
jgi:hypothetical protein